MTRIADLAAVSATLANPLFTMPPVPTGGPAVGIRWLRRNVARFSDGAEHNRRRRHVTTLLNAVAPAKLRQLSTERTNTVLDDAGRLPLDLMARVARVVPIDVLVAALAIPPLPVDAVAMIATAYQPDSGSEEPADEAIIQLVDAFGGEPDEATAAKIALLVQTYDATAGQVGNAALTLLRADKNRPAHTIVAETLRHDPPVRITRRLAPDTGTLVEIDLGTSGLPFGSGPH